MITKEQIKEIAVLYESRGATELAKGIGCTKQRVEQIACDLRKHGVNIPKLRFYQKALNEAITELQAEKPDLFVQN